MAERISNKDVELVLLAGSEAINSAQRAMRDEVSLIGKRNMKDLLKTED